MKSGMRMGIEEGEREREREGNIGLIDWLGV